MATPGATPGSAVQYCYMFEGDKRPTKQLDALLRAIAMHIIRKIGDRNEPQLTPKKLAAFYQTVGGDYDSIFIAMPNSSISYIWQVTGCQHTLLPTDNDFAPPSIPALTPRGFSRWESVEILLGPEEHVPFLQFAVKNWNLRHPETGECFPTDLPADVFPSEADEEVDLWHKACGERLTREAAGRPVRPTRHAKHEQEPEPANAEFSQNHTRNHSQGGTPRHRQNDADYFGRSFSYVNAPSSGRPPKHGHSSRSPEKRSRSNRSFNDRVRRRSFPDLAASPRDDEPEPRYAHDEAYLDSKEARRPATGRRHSHPRHYSSDEDMEPEPVIPRSRRRQGVSPPGIRRFSPPESGHGSGSSSSRTHRAESDLKKRVGPSPLGSLRSKLTETVSSFLPNGRTSRPNSRNQGSNEHLRQRRSREQVRPTRLNRSHSDLDSDNDSDMGPLDDMSRRRRRPEERDRDRYRDGGRFREEDREDERDSGMYRDRQQNRRADVYRRTSSHADVDRRREQDNWDLRDRERLKKWDKERRSSPEETLDIPPLNGQFFSRRHPEPAYS
ncbi:hydroxyproline-rich glyco DZ-HRGP [Cordyceps militaris]|nr:hydroxyproline-rich glyco DZ-HRGP [Cordyceps militaris]